jgi:hypothetical protein
MGGFSVTSYHLLWLGLKPATLIGDQLEILKWLIQKFPQQTKEYKK